MNRDAKVGLFVIVALLAMGYFVMNTTEVESLWKETTPKKELRVELTDATGVRTGTPVRVAGVKVGEIVRIDLESGRAYATVEVPIDLELRDDIRVELRSQGILGERYIAIAPGQGAPLEEGGTLTANTPPSLEDITATINAVGENLKIITANMAASTQTDAGGNRIDLIATNIEKLTEAS